MGGPTGPPKREVNVRTRKDKPFEDVAVFIDFENIYISVRNRYESNPNFESIMDLCQRYGRVTIARAYADWYRYPRVTNALYANAIEPMYVPTYYYDREEGRTGRAIKNSVDMHLCIDMMKTLYAFPNIETYVLITGDRDFIPLINAVRQLGKHTVVIGVADATASHLAQAADEFLYYNQVVAEGTESEADANKDPFEILVQAIHLARERKLVTTLATLKLLMIDLLPNFDEGKFKGRNGKPFTKFKDFLREAEQRKLVQIFTRGSVTEVFLPGENPFNLSQFAPELPKPVEAEVVETAEVSDEEPVISDRDWAVFEEIMNQFDQPALFIQIYDALRGMRNKEIMDLSNNDIKHMMKVAINEGLLERLTRGSHAYYKLDKSRPFHPAKAVV
ncbi:hypothetical protein DCC79_04005 [bacterium]|nr:NYN domain-containing protein [Chloroflexi bacterium CFX6]RIL11706.1 MAG: hypothetical protein DCC79_04005 [bacterium]